MNVILNYTNPEARAMVAGGLRDLGIQPIRRTGLELIKNRVDAFGLLFIEYDHQRHSEIAAIINRHQSDSNVRHWFIILDERDVPHYQEVTRARVRSLDSDFLISEPITRRSLSSVVEVARNELTVFKKYLSSSDAKFTASEKTIIKNVQLKAEWHKSKASFTKSAITMLVNYGFSNIKPYNLMRLSAQLTEINPLKNKDYIDKIEKRLEADGAFLFQISHSRYERLIQTGNNEQAIEQLIKAHSIYSTDTSILLSLAEHLLKESNLNELNKALSRFCSARREHCLSETISTLYLLVTMSGRQYMSVRGSVSNLLKRYCKTLRLKDRSTFELCLYTLDSIGLVNCRKIGKASLTHRTMLRKLEDQVPPRSDMLFLLRNLYCLKSGELDLAPTENLGRLAMSSEIVSAIQDETNKAKRKIIGATEFFQANQQSIESQGLDKKSTLQALATSGEHLTRSNFIRRSRQVRAINAFSH